MSKIIKLEQIRIRMMETLITENKQLRKQLKENEEDYNILQDRIEALYEELDELKHENNRLLDELTKNTEILSNPKE